MPRYRIFITTLALISLTVSSFGGPVPINELMVQLKQAQAEHRQDDAVMAVLTEMEGIRSSLTAPSLRVPAEAQAAPVAGMGQTLAPAFSLATLDTMYGAEENTDAAEMVDPVETETVDGKPVIDGQVFEEPPGARKTSAEDAAASNANFVKAMSNMMKSTSAQPAAAPVQVASVAAPAKPVWKGDPLDQPVDIEFRDMELTNVVSALANKAGINIITGEKMDLPVTLSFQNVPLRKAIETVLHIYNLGMIEEEGIYRIVQEDEAYAAEREVMLVALDNAKAEEVRKSVEDILKTSEDGAYVSVSHNEAVNSVVVSGPKSLIQPYVDLAKRFDVSKQVLPTVTEAIRLNYSDPTQMMVAIEKMFSEQGMASADVRSNTIVVTDIPVKVEEVKSVIASLDIAERAVSINAMMVDVFLDDEASTGVDWLFNLIGATPDGVFSEDTFGLSHGPEGTEVAFGIVNGNTNLSGLIQAEVKNGDAVLISSPTINTLENTTAKFTIASEIAYKEEKESSAGGSQTTIAFKEVGTILEVKPRTTHDNHIIVELNAKESDANFQESEDGPIPTEEKRVVENTLRMNDGQTIFVGGLRKRNDDLTSNKVPILGDIPVAGFLFSTRKKAERVNELLVFLTCDIIEDEMPDLTEYQQEKLQEIKDIEIKADVEPSLYRAYAHPEEIRDPAIKWRRSK